MDHIRIVSLNVKKNPAQTSYLSLETYKAMFSVSNTDQPQLKQNVVEGSQVIDATPTRTDAGTGETKLASVNPTRNEQRIEASRVFPHRLFSLLKYAHKQGLDNVIAWQPHGRAFLIKDGKKFIEQTQQWPAHLRYHKLSSFLRQLNLYNFKRFSQGPDKGAYYHPNFTLHSTKQDLASMVRSKVKHVFVRQKADASSEPNFYGQPYSADYPSAPMHGKTNQTEKTHQKAGCDEAHAADLAAVDFNLGDDWSLNSSVEQLLAQALKADGDAGQAVEMPVPTSINLAAPSAVMKNDSAVTDAANVKTSKRSATEDTDWMIDANFSDFSSEAVEYALDEQGRIKVISE